MPRSKLESTVVSAHELSSSDAADAADGSVLAYVGLGANLGDAAATIEAAFEALAGLERTELVARSLLYRSAPVDAAGPDFTNAVAALRTCLRAQELLTQLQAIENRFGRRREYHNAPRTLDLDILLYGDLTLDSQALQVPHPRMHERAFVLRPLAAIASALSIPGRGPISKLLEAVADQRIEPVP